jgi:hypothetical protein
LHVVRPHTASCTSLAAVISLCNYAPESYGLEREDESAIAGTFVPLQQKSKEHFSEKIIDNKNQQIGKYVDL